MTTPTLGQDWLLAAIGGGLPEPSRSRWQPLRVGIVNLWEYDDAQFWFADGRLVLRGGNGTGKTKVLELTTLMLLRGEISPAVLDPFGSQHRTMRFNLLPSGDGDDPRPPADAGLGYAWAEFGRLDELGRPHYYVCGMGAAARRGAGTASVTTWHFVTALRPGKDLALVEQGRAIDAKTLRAIDGVTVPATASAYRAALAADLFGVGPESYDNLTELLKQLRRPKLGERLNPASLSQTLRESLPPLATAEVAQLAEGWEHLEQLREAIEQSERAATAVVRFARGGWRPWARAVLKNRADAVSSATTRLDNTTKDKNRAETELAAARRAVTGRAEDLAVAGLRRRECEVEREELVESRSYRDAVAATGRVQELSRRIDGLTGQQRATGRRRAQTADSVHRAQARVAATGDELERAVAEVADSTARLRAEAGPAGLEEAVDRHLPTLELDQLQTEHSRRAERSERLTVLHREHLAAQERAERSAQALERAERSQAEARAALTAAQAQVERAVGEFQSRLRAWSGQAVQAGCTPAQLEAWVDLVTDLATLDPVSGGPLQFSVIDLVRAQVAAVRVELAGQAEQLRLEQAVPARRLQEARAELAVLQGGEQLVPQSPTGWRRGERPGPDQGQGAPLWRLVNPVGGLEPAVLDRLEAALAGCGLLDAWIRPDGIEPDQALPLDLTAVPSGPADGPSLLAVLEPVGAAGVTAGTVGRVLAAVQWRGEGASGSGPGSGPWLAADGSWRMGELAGTAEPVRPASFLGAEAREAFRLREVDRLEAELAALTDRLGELGRRLAELAARTDQLTAEEDALPAKAERNLTVATVRWAERDRVAEQRDGEVAQQRLLHEADLQVRESARAALAQYAAEHRLPLHDLEEFRAALHRFAGCLTGLRHALQLRDDRQSVADQAREELTSRTEALHEVDEELADLADELGQEQVRLRTAQSLLDSGHREQLDRKQALERELTELNERLRALTEQLGQARESAGRAEGALAGHEDRRAEAEQQRDRTVVALWAGVDAGLASEAVEAVPDRRTVQSAREYATALRRRFTSPVPDDEVDRRWRACQHQLGELRQELLPNRDARIQESEEPGGLPAVLVLTDQTEGWLGPAQAAEVLAERVRAQQAGYDEEQQRVLTTLLGSAFIEHLKERLDYAERTFSRINTQLAGHPTRQGHVVRILHEADPVDADAGAVVQALSRGYRELSAERQEMVRAFLARKIEETRRDAALDGAAHWQEQLAAALDYRSWLRLTLQYRAGGSGSWTAFDAARHGAKSGGEKVVLLSQPLFAAAVVAFDAAGPHAPRWVWLDEAMTGVDADVKASFLGLTVEFELDLMLTAHDEWGTYPTVPAVAIYDLARQKHLPGVDAMPYLWCGGELTTIDVEQLGAAPAASIPADGLFAEPVGGPADA